MKYTKKLGRVKYTLILISIIVGYIVFFQYEHKKKEDEIIKRNLDLAKIWNSISQNFAYWDQIGGTDQWDEAYENAVRNVSKCKSDYEYLELLEEFLAVLQDGNASVLDGAGIDNVPAKYMSQINKLDWGALPFEVDIIDNKFIVSKCLNNSTIPLYSEITQINNCTPYEYLENNYGHRVGCRTAGGRVHMLASAFRFAKAGTQLQITYNTLGKENTAFITYDKNFLGISISPRANEQVIGNIIYSGDYFNIYKINNIVYIKIFGLNGQSMENTFEKYALPSIYNSDGCILDLRECKNGDSVTARKIMQYFTRKELPEYIKSYALRSGLEMYVAWLAEIQMEGVERYTGTKLLERGRKMRSGQYYYTLYGADISFCKSIKTENEKEIANLNKRYNINILDDDYADIKKTIENIPCIMLIDAGTSRAGECMAVMAKEAEITLIGERTAGICGEIAMEQLNNGWIIEYSAGNIYAPNGDAIWNQGIMPDIEKSVSLNDYMSGNDSVRKYAIEYINNYTK